MRIYLSVIIFIFLLTSNLYALEYKLAKKWGGYGREEGKFERPMGLAIDRENYIYITDYSNHRIQKFTLEGEFVKKWGKEEIEDKDFKCPADITIDGEGNIYVTNGYCSAGFYLWKFSKDMKLIKKWKVNWMEEEPGRDSRNEEIRTMSVYASVGISRVEIDSKGNIYVLLYYFRGSARSCSYQSFQIQKYNSKGEFVELFIKDIFYKKGKDALNGGTLAICAKGDYIYIADDEGIKKYTLDGKLVEEIVRVKGITVLWVDENKNIYALKDAFFDNQPKKPIIKYDRKGKIIFEWKVFTQYQAPKYWPMDITTDRWGNVYVIEGLGDQILKYTPAPAIEKTTTYAYPNPVKGNKVNFKYQLSDEANIEISIYNIAGELIATLSDQSISGIKETTWHIPDKVASGVYLFQIKAISINTGIKSIVTKKLAIIR